ncbi:MAG: hypothetical protein AAFQ40_02875 [Cyanobacteria bacterium J06623_5]
MLINYTVKSVGLKWLGFVEVAGSQVINRTGGSLLTMVYRFESPV